MTDSGIDITDLNVMVEGATLLNQVRLAVARGRRCAVVGPSGAGKTTLIRAIAGLVESTGTICIDDRDVTGMAPQHRQLGVVTQRPMLLPHMRVIENVELPLRARRVARTARKRIALDLLDLVGVAPLADRSVHGLSGGEAQRVALARALATEPRALLLDEPLSAVDPEARAQLQQTIIDVQRQSGATLLVVTHDRDEALALGQTIAVMVRGCIVAHATPNELITTPGRADVARLVGRGAIIAADQPLAGRLAPGRACPIWLPHHAVYTSEPAASAESVLRLEGQLGRSQLTQSGFTTSFLIGDLSIDVVTAHPICNEAAPGSIWIDTSLVSPIKDSV